MQDVGNLVGIVGETYGLSVPLAPGTTTINGIHLIHLFFRPPFSTYGGPFFITLPDVFLGISPIVALRTMRPPSYME
ncbi:hypothetical protein BKA82DRAFT_4200651 [Pisolithus tinctorius]|nr:hypothetical protein BKA82DRAFT_4200651 [Pisolithus tinctorius]